MLPFCLKLRPLACFVLCFNIHQTTIWLLMQVLLMSHVGEENCASVWSFSYFSAADYDASTNSGVSHEAKEHNWSR